MKNAKATNFITSKEIALKGLSLTVKNGGATINPKTGETVTSGYAVGGVREFKFYNARIGQLEEIIEAVKEIRLEHKNCEIGFWMDGGTLYLDAIVVMADEAGARLVGEKFGEIAIFNLDTKEEIRLK